MTGIRENIPEKKGFTPTWMTDHNIRREALFPEIDCNASNFLPPAHCTFKIPDIMMGLGIASFFYFIPLEGNSRMNLWTIFEIDRLANTENTVSSLSRQRADNMLELSGKVLMNKQKIHTPIHYRQLSTWPLQMAP